MSVTSRAKRAAVALAPQRVYGVAPSLIRPPGSVDSVINGKETCWRLPPSRHPQCRFHIIRYKTSHRLLKAVATTDRPRVDHVPRIRGILTLVRVAWRLDDTDTITIIR